MIQTSACSLQNSRIGLFNAIQHIHYQVSYKVYVHTINHADYGLQLEEKINHLLCLKDDIQLSTYLVHITMPISENEAQ